MRNFRKHPLSLSLGLMLGLLLPISCTSMAAEPVQVVRLDPASSPALQALMDQVKYQYEIRYGSPSQPVEYPKELLMIQWLGKDSELVKRVCTCYGQTSGFVGSSAILVQVMEDTGEWTPDFILAHELTHVLHVHDRRWRADQRSAFEEEAEGIAWSAITQLRSAGVPTVFGGADAVRKKIP